MSERRRQDGTRAGAVGRLAKILTWFYDKGRSKKSLDAAEQTPSGRLTDLEGHKYCLVITYRKNDTPVATPVWFGIAHGKLYFQTGADDGKVKRIRNNGHVRIAPCSARGRPLGPPFSGRARFMAPNEEADADRWIQDNYGLGRRIYERLLAQRVPGVYVEVTPAET